MPLHLLGKKSWNVYNQDNIERVKRDEAVAKAKEEAEEQRQQEIDAERRIQILRGEIPMPLPEVEDKPSDDGREDRSYAPGRERKKRKKAGEDDTDFEMRIAHDRTTSANTNKQISLRKPVNAPLVDHAGHIDLFPQEQPRKVVQKNPEAEAETAKKKKEYEDQYTMRFSNAAGFKQGLDSPWYSRASAKAEAIVEGEPGKDVWGNEDPRRKDREAARIVSSDPLAAMRQGAAQVRQVERERKRWREETEKQTRELAEAERRKTRHKRRHRDDVEDLEGFSLDGPQRDMSRRREEHDGDRERRHQHKESKHKSHRDESSRHRHSHKHRHRD